MLNMKAQYKRHDSTIALNSREFFDLKFILIIIPK
ncbi:MAG: hypothetical protein RLZZ574_2321 [Cyanobacteriota bacterium]|jgi:hypothetical protein